MRRCRGCGQEYEYRKGETGYRFCSDACRDRPVCRTCGREYQYRKKYNGYHYCCVACREGKNPVTGWPCEADDCDTLIVGSNSNRRYCSIACAHRVAYRWRKQQRPKPTTVVAECPRCLERDYAIDIADGWAVCLSCGYHGGDSSHDRPGVLIARGKQVARLRARCPDAPRMDELLALGRARTGLLTCCQMME